MTHRKTWNDESALYSDHCSLLFRFSEQPTCQTVNKIKLKKLDLTMIDIFIWNLELNPHGVF